MMKAFRNSVMLILMVALLALPGCGKPATAPQNEGAKAVSSIVVKDGLNRDVKIDGNVESIVSSYGIALHMVVALGAADLIQAIDVPSMKSDFFKATIPQNAQGKSVGSPRELNIEEVAALDPDLVLVPGRNQEMVESLEKRGITVFGVVAETPQELNLTMLNLGKALGREQVAQEFVDYYDQTIKDVKDRLAGLEKSQRPRVYLVGPMGILSTCSSDMYQHELIAMCGGENVAAQLQGKLDGHGWLEIPAEQLITWDPEVILVVQYSGAKPADILNDSRFRNIQAVKDKKVYWFPSDLNPWDYPSPQAVLGVKWLAATLHPDCFENVNMQVEADNFFNRFYGKSFTGMGGKL
ncbi:ABC transporter substrate-binding protein [Syntrophomonas wolfei]|jgi:iron complex transport system substrate-binding protein|uniref:ABC transporter substrate-binding protein n=2 Tax=Syntrophomonas wolfei TaxID=863 RepID=UPI0009E665A5|nr:ABC transporter substrate-binding protein [Syntrophomonas wolfei]